jgi:hypothetical protein
MQNARRQPRALAAVLIGMAVLLGAAMGIAFDRLVLLPRAGYAGEPTAPAPAVHDRDTARATGDHWIGMGRRPTGERYLRHLEAELGLTPEQTRRLDAILEDQQARVMEITRESRPQIRAVAEDTRAAIRQVLTEEQWQRFQELRQRRDRHHGGGGRDSLRR